jgi:hypothetical protein
MPSLPKEAWDWLVRAQKECRAAQQESDRKSKRPGWKFAHICLHFAQTITDVAIAQFGLATRSDPPN